MAPTSTRRMQQAGASFERHQLPPHDRDAVTMDHNRLQRCHRIRQDRAGGLRRLLAARPGRSTSWASASALPVFRRVRTATIKTPPQTFRFVGGLRRVHRPLLHILSIARSQPGLGPDTEKRTVSSAQIQDLRLAIVSSGNSSRFLRSATIRARFKGGGGKCCFGLNPAMIGTATRPGASSRSR
jgi:hypothetical protein